MVIFWARQTSRIRANLFPQSLKPAQCQVVCSSYDHTSFKRLFNSNKIDHEVTSDDSKTEHDYSLFERLPNPTWSIQELNLLESHGHDESNEAMTNEELRKLANRCCILTNQSENGSSGIDALKTDVQNIMRCISLVSSYDATKKRDNTTDHNLTKTVTDIYDFGRGDQYKCPIRSQDQEQTEWHGIKGENIVASNVKDNLKADGKLVRSKDQSWYFSIMTNQ